jgi:hypothetical protein
MIKVVIPCISTVGVHYFGLFIPFHYYLLPLYLPRPHFSRVLITHSCFLYLHITVCNFTDGLSFSFLFPLSLSSIQFFHWFQSALHLSEYMIIIVFMYKFLIAYIFFL